MEFGFSKLPFNAMKLSFSPQVVLFGLFLSFVFGYLVYCSGDSLLTKSLVLSSCLMFVCMLGSAWYVLGRNRALLFCILGVCIGFIAEFVGVGTGWVFGEYYFTDVLGPKLLDVPLVIPLMWFSLCYMAYVISCILIVGYPRGESSSLFEHLLISFLVALLVTSFDLGADPFFVYEVKAWIMHKNDGAWFGETVHGFVGWILVSFLIAMAYQRSSRKCSDRLPVIHRSWAAFPSLANFSSFMVFQVIFGRPDELKVVAIFAMGVPIYLSLVRIYFRKSEGKNEGV